MSGTEAEQLASGRVCICPNRNSLVELGFLTRARRLVLSSLEPNEKRLKSGTVAYKQLLVSRVVIVGG